MMLPRNHATDWDSLWADLLQGIGAGLLHYDGSPLAQAALMGLEAFDAAQQRRGRWDARGSRHDPDSSGQETDAPLPPGLSTAEIAAFQRLGPEEQAAFEAELAEAEERESQSGNDDPSSARQRRLPAYPGTSGRSQLAWRPPASASPFDGWPLEAVLPFSRDGRLNLPNLRR